MSTRGEHPTGEGVGISRRSSKLPPNSCCWHVLLPHPWWGGGQGGPRPSSPGPAIQAASQAADLGTARVVGCGEEEAGGREGLGLFYGIKIPLRFFWKRVTLSFLSFSSMGRAYILGSEN